MWQDRHNINLYSLYLFFPEAAGEELVVEYLIEREKKSVMNKSPAYFWTRDDLIEMFANTLDMSHSLPAQTEICCNNINIQSFNHTNKTHDYVQM